MRFSSTPNSTRQTLLPVFRELLSNRRWKEVICHYNEIKAAGVELVEHSIFSHVLKACISLSLRVGKSVHASVIKQGFVSFQSVRNSVIDFYAKSGALRDALGFFYCVKIKDSVSWNIILHGHFNQGAIEEGLELYIVARGDGFDPNVSTLLFLIQAYRFRRLFSEGFIFHGYLIRSGLWNLVAVQNSMLGLYTDMGMEYAENLFDEMLERDVISWSVMIQGYVYNDQSWIALELFHQVIHAVGIEVDGQIMVSLLKGCSNLGDIRIGKSFHGFVFVRGWNFDLFVGNTLVDLYCKLNDVDSGVKAFNEMPQRNLVSWNSMLYGFVHNEKHSEVFTLFRLMGNSGIIADESTLVSILQSCKVLGVLHQCKLIHSRAIRNCFKLNELVMNALIDAYAKCDWIDYAYRLFCQVESPDVVTWSTMISGFTQCGMPFESISMYIKMRTSLSNQSSITLLNLLEACAMASELKISKWAHAISIRMDLASNVVLGTAILDMYSKCGAIEESRKAFGQISMKNVVSWSAIISACGLNGLPRDALSLLSEMKTHGLTPNSVTMLSVLSACCHGGLIEEGLSIFVEMMKNYGDELKIEHISCLVDLLARSGNFDSALHLIKSLPGGMKPSASAWGALLNASRNYQNRDFAAAALSQVLDLEPLSSSSYVLASSMYAAEGLWLDASRMRSPLQERGVKVVAGYSLVHVNNCTYSFTAGDKSHRSYHLLCPVIEQLHLFIKTEMGATPLVS